MYGHLNVELFTALSPISGNYHKVTSSAVRKNSPTSQSAHPLVPCIKNSYRFADSSQAISKPV